MATFTQMMDRINQKLELNSQQVRVVAYERSALVLSTGHKLEGKEAALFKRRIFSIYTDIWIKHMDDLLNGEITEASMLRSFATQRGKNSWSKNSDKIRKNLNTGIPWSKGRPGSFLGRNHTEISKRKIGEKNSGKNNGMYGKPQSIDSKKKKSIRMKEKILSGEFTPNSTNRHTRWQTEFNGKKYRSSWEALYHSYNQQAEYEQLRLPYSYNDQEHIYIVDFIDHCARTVAEVKPDNMWELPETQAKISALKSWALDNDYRVLMVDQTWLVSNIPCPKSLEVFDQNTAKRITSLYEAHKKD